MGICEQLPKTGSHEIHFFLQPYLLGISTPLLLPLWKPILLWTCPNFAGSGTTGKKKVKQNRREEGLGEQPTVFQSPLQALLFCPRAKPSTCPDPDACLSDKIHSRLTQPGHSSERPPTKTYPVTKLNLFLFLSIQDLKK